MITSPKIPDEAERYLGWMKATIDCLRQENLEILKMNKEIIQDNARLRQDNDNLTIELKEKTKECGCIRLKSAEDKNNSKVEIDELKLEVKRLKDSERNTSARHFVIKDLSIELEKNGRALKDSGRALKDSKLKVAQKEKENMNLVKENSKLKDDLTKLQNEVVRDLSIEIKLKSKTLNDLKLEMAAEGKSENATLMDEMEGYITPSTRGIIIGEFNPLSFNYLLIYGMYMKTSSFAF